MKSNVMDNSNNEREDLWSLNNKKQNYILKHTVSSHVHKHSHISLHQEMLFIVLYNSYGIHPENWKQTVCKVKYKIHIYTLYT